MFEVTLWEDITKSWFMVYSLWKPELWCPVFVMRCSASRGSYSLQSSFHHDLVARHNRPHNTGTFYPAGVVFPHTYISLCHQETLRERNWGRQHGWKLAAKMVCLVHNRAAWGTRAAHHGLQWGWFLSWRALTQPSISWQASTTISELGWEDMWTKM